MSHSQGTFSDSAARFPRGTLHGFALVTVLIAGAAVIGCGSNSGAESDWEGAENLRFSSDAQDPTEKAKEGGWYRFRPKEEVEGAASPLDPDARGHGFGPANNKPN